MARFLYNVGILIYELLIFKASVFSSKARKLINGRRQSFRTIAANIGPSDRVIWFHAASLGEFEQGRPVIEAIRKSHPEFKILLTFYSPSGYEVRKNYAGADAICYLPTDHSWNARKLLSLAHPEMAIFIKYEFWPNFLTVLHANNIPVYCVSAIFRPKQLFFHPWGGFYSDILRKFRHIFVQDEDSIQLLRSIGIENTSISGDTRFDRVTSITANPGTFPEIEQFIGGQQTVVAGSSWPADEELIVPILKETDYKAIIAPHEITGTHLSSLASLCGKGNYVFYSELITKESFTSSAGHIRMDVNDVNNPNSREKSQNAQFLIIDSIGILSSLYQYGDFAYIGGGFGVGIHNILEAASYGKAVVFGPNYQNFKEARDLERLGAAFPVNTPDSFRATIMNIARNPGTGLTAGKYTKENTGATQKIVNRIFKN